MSIIVEVTTVEADTLTVDVIALPLAVMVVDVVNSPPDIIAVEVVEFGGPPISYVQLPLELRQLPISFPFQGKIPTRSQINVPMGFAVNVPANLAGTMTWARAPSAADATFMLNRIDNGVVDPLGTVTLTPGASTSNRCTGPGGRIPAGGVLQIISPDVQDAALSDIGITVMVNRE